jgi:ribonucleotide reductase beta subunit family protein with ferritin-like domain
MYADGFVAENVMFLFIRDTSHIKEAFFFYTGQGSMEITHSETYSRQGQIVLGDDIKEEEEMYNAIETDESLKSITTWMLKWMNPDKNILSRIIGFICVEGIIFTSIFVSIYWIKKNPNYNLPGICLSNEWIARDEMLHTGFGIELYHHFIDKENHKKLEQDEVYEIIKSAIEVVSNFGKAILEVDLVGLSSDDLIEYNKCHADKILDMLGYKKYYNSKNPFQWMKMLAIPNKSNFFEKGVSEYSRNTETDYSSKYDEDF